LIFDANVDVNKGEKQSFGVWIYEFKHP